MIINEIKVTDIKGIKVGHAQDIQGGTGCTVILCEEGATAGVDVRGGGPATRETDLLKSENMVQQIHAVMLSGGSAYGLDAASGAMQYLEEKGYGFNVGVGIVPIVCGASLFDLVVGDPKCRPDKAMGYEACCNANTMNLKQGNYGAGTGATVGKYLGIDRLMKSGIGIHAVQIGEIQVAAIVAVNALGDIIDPTSGQRIAGILSEDKCSIGNTAELMMSEIAHQRNVFSGNTTIGCIVTNASITKTQANKLASMTHNAYGKTICPVHTSADGDSIFVMATGEVEVSLDTLGTIATDVMSKAIIKGVMAAEPAYGLKVASQFK